MSSPAASCRKVVTHCASVAVSSKPFSVEKQFRNDQAGALVAVQERVIARDAESVARGQARDRVLAIGELVLGSRQGRFEQPAITHTGLAAVLGELLVMDGEHDLPADPDGP